MTIRISTGFRNVVCSISPVRTLMDGGTIYLYGGTMPDNPDLAPDTPILGQVTTDGFAFMPSSEITPAGLRVDWKTPGSLVKASNWILRGSATGKATWFRWCWRMYDDHLESGYYPRLDGTVISPPDFGSGPLLMSNPNIFPNRVVSIDSFILVLPVGN